MKRSRHCAFLLGAALSISNSSIPALAGDPLTRGVEAFHSGDFAAAARFLRVAAEAGPDRGMAHQLLGWMHWLAGEEDESFARLFQSLTASGEGKEIVLHHLAGLDLRPSQRKSLISLFRFLAEYSPDQTLRALSRWYGGRLCLEEGDLELARTLFQELHFWPDWRVIGPFDNQEGSGFAEVYPPEEEIDLGASYPGKIREVSWSAVADFDFSGIVDLGAILRPNRGAAAYLLAFVYSPVAAPAALRLGSDGRFQLWLNDQLLTSQDQEHALVLDQDVLGARLSPGWNKILLKSCVTDGDWRVGLRITAPDGSALGGLRASSHPRPYPSSGDRSTRPSTLRREPPGNVGGALAQGSGTEPFEFAQDKLSRSVALSIETDAGLSSRLDEIARRRDLTALELSWKAQGAMANGYREKAVEEFERLLDRCPRCPYYHQRLGEVFQGQGKPSQALREFKTALKLLPGAALPKYSLARHYQRGGLWEQALEQLDPLLEEHPGFLPARLQRSLVYFRKGWTEDAWREALRAAEEFPDSAWARDCLGIYAEEKERWDEARREYRRAIELDHAYSDPRLRLCRLDERAGDFSRAAKRYLSVLSFSPLSAPAHLNAARCYRADGDGERAVGHCRAVLRFCPRHHEAQALLGDIFYERGEEDRALRTWDEALLDEPDDLRLREYLRHLRPERKAVFERYGCGDRQVEEMAAAAPPADRYPRASAIVLFDQAIDQVFSDGSSTQQVHQVVKILNQKGISQYSQVSIPDTSALRLIRAVTVSPSGEEREATAIGNGVISMPALEPGSVVEWKYAVDRRSGGWLEQHYYQTFYFQDENPLIKSQYVLALPEGRRFVSYRRGARIDFREETMGGYRVYVWESDDNEGICDEYDAPPRQDLAALVSVSTILSWDELARWQNSLIKDQFEMDAAIREKLAALTKGLPTVPEKIRAVYDYVVSEIRYLNIGQGIFGKKPHRAVDIFANRYGDCKDKVTLMIAMLKELGIRAHYAGIRTRSSGRIIPEVPSCQTNHILVYVPAQEGLKADLFLDGTAQYLSYPCLPDDDQAVEAFVLLGDGYRYVTTPTSSPETNGKSLSDRILIQEDGSIEVEEEGRLRGIYAQSYRDALRVKGKRREDLERIINATAPGAVLAEAEFDGLDDLKAEVTITARFRAPGFAEKTKTGLRFSPLFRFSLTKSFAKQANRIYDLETDFTRRVESEERYRLPEGYDAAALPETVELDNRLASFSLAYRREGRDVVCRRSFALKVLTVEQEEYASFRQFCLDCDQAEKRNVVIEKMESEK